MNLSPRQSFNLACELQLHRVKVLVGQQTPPSLHSLPQIPLIPPVVASNRRSGEERSGSAATPQRHRTNRRAEKYVVVPVRADVEKARAQRRRDNERRRYAAKKRAAELAIALTQES